MEQYILYRIDPRQAISAILAILAILAIDYEHKWAIIIVTNLLSLTMVASLKFVCY